MSGRTSAPAEAGVLGRIVCGLVGALVGAWFALEGMVVLAFGRGALHVVRGLTASALAVVVVGMWAFGRPAAPGWRVVVAVALVPLYVVAFIVLG